MTEPGERKPVSIRFQEEVALWLVRSALAGIVAAVVWASGTLVRNRELSQEAYDRAMIRFDSLEMMGVGAVSANSTYVAIRDSIQARANTLWSIDKGGEINHNLPSATDANVFKAELFAVTAAVDSVKVAASDLLVMPASSQRRLRALEVNLSRERVVWSRLATALRTPQNTSNHEKALDALSDAQHDWIISWEGMDALYEAEKAAWKTITRASAKNAEKAHEEQKRLGRQWKIAFAILYVGLLLCLGLISYAVTGKPDSIALPSLFRRWGTRQNAPEKDV